MEWKCAPDEILERYKKTIQMTSMDVPFVKEKLQFFLQKEKEWLRKKGKWCKV